jgi:hypothetical protein
VQRHQLAAIGQRDRIVKGSVPVRQGYDRNTA